MPEIGTNDAVLSLPRFASSQIDGLPVDPLKPLPPLPPLQASSDDEDRPRKRTSRILSWATLVAAGGALAVGILHGMGASMFEVLWHHFN